MAPVPPHPISWSRGRRAERTWHQPLVSTLPRMYKEAGVGGAITPQGPQRTEAKCLPGFPCSGPVGAGQGDVSKVKDLQRM